MNAQSDGNVILDLQANEDSHPRAATRKAAYDPDWIERCRQGDRDAFRLLFDAYKDRVYSFAVYTLNGDAAAAEDVAQEVFVRVYENIGRFRGDAGLTTWIYRIAANACVDELRRAKRGPIPMDGEPVPDICAHLGRVELSSALRSALAQLPAEQRTAITLKYFEELSYADMATALECSKGTIASRLSRGLRSLAAALGGVGDSGARPEQKPNDERPGAADLGPEARNRE